MSVQYRSIHPVSQQESYTQNQNIDFILNLSNEKLIPGTVTLEGLCGIYSDKANLTGTAGHEEISYDPLTGYHGLLHDITTEFEQLGIFENLQHYGRLVKTGRLCTEYLKSLGTETKNSVEGCAPFVNTACGLAEGIGGNRGSKIPFSIKLQNVVNKMSAPVSSKATGPIRIRFRLAADDEFLWGENYVSGTGGYVLSELKIRFQTIPDDGKLQPVTFERYQAYSINLDTNNQNISAFVPGLCDSVHMSFIKVDNEDDPKKNYLGCEVPPGKPPLGATDSNCTPGEYGLERVYYAVADVDTALVGFTMESREELMMNGIRSFNPSLKGHNCLARRLRDQEYPDGYVLGIPMGAPIQMAQNKFAAELQSQCTNDNQYRAYMHFRCIEQVQA